MRHFHREPHIAVYNNNVLQTFIYVQKVMRIGERFIVHFDNANIDFDSSMQFGMSGTTYILRLPPQMLQQLRIPSDT